MYKEKLLSLGIPADISGFEYLNDAIDTYKPLMGKIDLYERIAEKHDTEASRVERCMRYAIEKTFEKLAVGQFIAKYSILWKEGKTKNGNHDKHS